MMDNAKPETQYVVFVSGLVKVMSHDGQTSIFTQNFKSQYPVKSFNYTNLDGINNFLNNNNVVAIILFSKACDLATQLKISSQKIYCIEPWNGNDTDAGKSYLFNNIPASNMYIDYQSYSRGQGTKKGANATSHKNQHFGALASSAALISQKI